MGAPEVIQGGHPLARIRSFRHALQKLDHQLVLDQAPALFTRRVPRDGLVHRYALIEAQTGLGVAVIAQW